MESNSVIRAATVGNLTGDETLTSFLVGPMTRPMWLHVLVPTDSGGSDTLDVEIEFCTAAASTVEVYNMNMKQITADGHYAIPFFTKESYIQVKLNHTASGGNSNWGAVVVWVDPSGRYDKAVF